MEACSSTHMSPTANGDVEVTCRKPADHVERGDLVHQGKVGVFPVRWPADDQAGRSAT